MQAWVFAGWVLGRNTDIFKSVQGGCWATMQAWVCAWWVLVKAFARCVVGTFGATMEAMGMHALMRAGHQQRMHSKVTCVLSHSLR